MSGPHLHFLVPGSLDQATGGYRYDAHMVRGLRAMGWTVTVHELRGAFPEGDVRALDSLDDALSSIPAGTRVVVDGLAMGSLPEAMHKHAGRLRLVALVHHPLADETGLEEAEAGRLAALERRSLEACRGVIVTSDFTGRRVSLAMDVPEDRVRVVWPGTEVEEAGEPLAGTDDDSPVEGAARSDGAAGGSGSPAAAPLLLSVGAVIPRKGHDVLVEALSRIERLPWKCVVVGSLDADRNQVTRVRRSMEEAGLGDRVELSGEVERARLESLLAEADIFVLASHFEGYGMAITEALIRGVPIVSTTGGALPDTVPPDAGILVPPGDAESLAGALASLLDAGGADRRRDLAAAARRRAAELPDWDEAASRFARAVMDLTPDQRAHERVDEGSDEFSVDWLALREPHDHRSRSGELVGKLREWLARRRGNPTPDDATLGVVDLGAGTGSNLRYLASKLPGSQVWTLVDRDGELLARAGSPSSRIVVERVVGDLAREGMDAVAAADLVTGSAILDLVSRPWAEELVAACRDAGAAALFALSYDGVVGWWTDPTRKTRLGAEDGDSDPVIRAFNQHQRSDKGLGPALGPDAVPVLEGLFRQAGFTTVIGSSPWRLGPGDADLVRTLVDGWASAAQEARPSLAGEIAEWAEVRRRAVRRGSFSVSVGHLDLLALPPDP